MGHKGENKGKAEGNQGRKGRGIVWLEEGLVLPGEKRKGSSCKVVTDYKNDDMNQQSRMFNGSKAVSGVT